MRVLLLLVFAVSLFSWPSYAVPISGPSWNHILQARAEDGDPTSEYALAITYLNGSGTEKNPELAAKWFQAFINSQISAPPGKSDQNFNYTLIDAEQNLAQLYQDGDGVPKDEKVAAMLLKSAGRSAVEQGLHVSRLFFLLGKLYEDGRAVTADYSQAAAWYDRAARSENCGGNDIITHLAHLYLEGGPNLQPNYEEAYYWLRFVPGTKEIQDMKKNASAHLWFFQRRRIENRPSPERICVLP
jgi:TPR repeat protein